MTRSSRSVSPSALTTVIDDLLAEGRIGQDHLIALAIRVEMVLPALGSRYIVIN